MMLMKEILYEKVMERVGNDQILIFVHSRRETAKSAREIKEQAFANDELRRIFANDEASQVILEKEAEKVEDADLKELLPYGLAIHHAGMTRDDRQ